MDNEDWDEVEAEPHAELVPDAVSDSNSFDSSEVKDQVSRI